MLRYLRLGALAGPLPNNIVAGQVASAAPVMANFQSIVNNINNNIGNYAYDTPLDGAIIVMANGTPGLLMQPAGPLTSLAVTLPTAPEDATQAWLLSTEAVNTVAFSNGNIVGLNKVVALVPYIMVRYLYRLANNSWYRML